MALSTSTTIPKIVAANMLAKFRQSNVFAARTNQSYRNQLGSYGNEVIVNSPADVSVSDYSSGGSLTYASADVGSPVSISLNKHKAWAVTIDDLDAAASKPNVLAAAVAESAVAMGNAVDSDVRAAMDADATSGPTIALDHNSSSLGVDDFKFTTLHRLLDLSNIPRSGRWLLMGPYEAEVLQRIALKNDTLLAGNSTNRLSNGGVGSFAGFDIYVSGGQYSTLKSSKSTATMFAGVDSATGFVDRASKQERMRAESTFADRVRGLYSYGYKVLQPKGLLKMEVSVSNVPS